MGGIVAVRTDLTCDTVSSVAGRRAYPLPFRPIGAVRQHIGDELESTHVAETGENERHVSSYVPVLVSQPVRQCREYAGVVTTHNLLSDRELSPEDFLTLELRSQDSS